MLHVFDDCANEHYHRTVVETGEGHHEHSSTTIKKKVEINKRAGSFEKFERKKEKNRFSLF
jgi:ribosomal protein L20